jgi:hypothetical protein
MLLANLLLLFCLLTCAFALVKGGVTERIGAAIILANLVAGMANEIVLRNQLATLAIDGVTALALLPVAVRYASVWLGGVMLLYGLQFAFQAYYFVIERPRDELYMVLNNTNFVALTLCLAVGTAVAWRRRVRERGAVVAAT